MSIIRIQKRENPYVQIDKRCLEDTRLSWRARGILAYLLSKPDTWVVSMKDIETSGKEGREAVQSAMKELAANGYAKLEFTQSKDGKTMGKTWTISELPSNGFSAQNSTVERVNRRTAFPSDGFSTLSNNNNRDNEDAGDFEKPSQANQKSKARFAFAAQLPEDAGVVPNLGYSFETFWNDYGHKVGSKSKAQRAFEKLDEKDRGAIRDTIEAYKRETVTSDKARSAGGEFKAMRKHPLTYLNGREWETYLDREPEPEIPSEYVQAYQTYQEWVRSYFPQTCQRGVHFSKTQFVQFQKGRMVQVIGKESDAMFLKKAHEDPGAADAYTVYQKLVSERLKLRQV